MKKFKDLLKKEEQKEDEKQEEVFTQVQREMIKMSILKIGMRRYQMSEMSNDNDYSKELNEIQGAEVVLENTIAELSGDAQKNYLSQVEERAKNEGVSKEDVLAEDAITLNKAKRENNDCEIDPTSGRVKVVEKNGESKTTEDEFDNDGELEL